MTLPVRVSAEVGDERVAAPVDQHVRRLHVAVHDALVVRVLERARELHEQVLDDWDRKRCVLADDLLEGRALDELHDEEQQLGVVADRVDDDDVRVVELRRGARLALEAVFHAVVESQLRQHDFDGHLAVEPQVVREVHGGHATASELAADLVLAHRGRAQNGHEPRAVRVRLTAVGRPGRFDSRCGSSGGAACATEPVLGEDRGPALEAGECGGHQAAGSVMRILRDGCYRVINIGSRQGCRKGRSCPLVSHRRESTRATRQTEVTDGQAQTVARLGDDVRVHCRKKSVGDRTVG